MCAGSLPMSFGSALPSSTTGSDGRESDAPNRVHAVRPNNAGTTYERPEHYVATSSRHGLSPERRTCGKIAARSPLGFVDRGLRRRDLSGQTVGSFSAIAPIFPPNGTTRRR